MNTAYSESAVNPLHTAATTREAAISASVPSWSESRPRAARIARPSALLRSLRALIPLWVVALVTIPVAIECRLELDTPERSGLAYLQRHGLFAATAVRWESAHGFGRSLGIAGAIAMVVLSLYSVRRRVPSWSGLGRLPRWLDAHITLGLVGPVLATFHTAGNFGGIIAVAYWSMVIVVASGIAGRYLFAQVPRTLAGRERTREELEAELASLVSGLPSLTQPAGRAGAAVSSPKADGFWWTAWWRLGRAQARKRRALAHQLAEAGLDHGSRSDALDKVERADRLERQILMLGSTRRLLAQWHALHVPLVFVLYGVLGLHVAVAILFDTR